MAERPVLILGAGGFIGRALAARLAARGTTVRAAARTAIALGPGIEMRATGSLSEASDWPALLAGIGAVVHLASRAHAPAGSDDGWIEAQAAAAAALARAARAAGVARLVLMSSLKVHGDDSGAGRIRAGDPPAPADGYGRAKLRLEQAMAAEAGAALVVLRPPLVYGPGVKANFRALLRLVASGLPMPLAGIANRRSLIFLDNLLDLIDCALVQDSAAGHAFLMRDDQEPSTPELVRLIAHGLGRRPRLLPCPPGLLRTAARLAGRGAAAARLLGSLSVDDGATRAALGWRPRRALADGIDATCRWYRSPGADRL